MLKLLHKKYLLLGLFALLVTGYFLQKQLITAYENQNSITIEDRNGQEILIKPNERGRWARYSDNIPPRIKKLLLEKEDDYFYYHFGFNPWSIILRPGGGSSTITQQLVKILLKKESERSFKNKVIEFLYAISLESYQSKESILKMYVNSIYFGNQAQGLTEASKLYFGVLPDMLTDGQILQLLAAISSPTDQNPAQAKNKEIALSLAEKLNLAGQDPVMVDSPDVKENMQKYSHSSKSYFELRDFINDPSENNRLTIDNELTEKLRQIIGRNIEDLKLRDAGNASAIVVKLPENEILALIGSPDPAYFAEGYQINMLKEPRPIGSTIKPFIYLKSFEKGLRPYTLVNDREYKYITAIGFPLYPKNFDYKYRGEVSLHYALSNSLNVPAVKILEYVGLEDFYHFLEKDLEFKPIQDLDSYQLGIALGSLEMNLTDLAHYFTIFPNNGILKELKIDRDAKTVLSEKQIAEKKYIQLINKILNDRKTGIEQFGLKSDFNLFQSNYALKTGTSRDFRDSWVVGYTPDFLVGVWVGNSDNTPTEGVSGQLGAGRIWSEAMETLLNSGYNKKTPFEFDLLEEFYKEGTIEYGLPGDNYENFLNVLKEEDPAMILQPHDGDVFLLEKNTKIILGARETVKWFINEEFLGEGQDYIFIPQKSGPYSIKSKSADGPQETVNIYINE
ncbi:MAG: transglycosylase domain-containing protein [Candidatus Nealsonbacteria bacterium]